MVSLDTAKQSITVEPCADAKSRHQNGQVRPYQARAAAEDCIIKFTWVFAAVHKATAACAAKSLCR